MFFLLSFISHPYSQTFLFLFLLLHHHHHHRPLLSFVTPGRSSFVFHHRYLLSSLVRCLHSSSLLLQYFLSSLFIHRSSLQVHCPHSSISTTPLLPSCIISSLLLSYPSSSSLTSPHRSIPPPLLPAPSPVSPSLHLSITCHPRPSLPAFLNSPHPAL